MAAACVVDDKRGIEGANDIHAFADEVCVRGRRSFERRATVRERDVQ